MHTPPLLGDLLIILAFSVPVAYACLRLKLPLLVGLMLTGILIAIAVRAATVAMQARAGA